MMDTLGKTLGRVLGAGLLPHTITCIYGPPGSGKTNIALMAAASVAVKEKVIYLDAEGGFSIERLKQICGKKLDQILANIIILEPHDFDEQRVAIMKLDELVNRSKAGLVIVDSIGVLYRLEEKKDYKVFGRVISQLMKVARKNNIPVLMTNQVYMNIDTGRNVPVGGTIIKYWSKILLELEKQGDCRTAIIRKHKFLQEGMRVDFEIINEGVRIKEVYEKQGVADKPGGRGIVTTVDKERI